MRVVSLVVGLFLLGSIRIFGQDSYTALPEHIWQVRSVDTMKISRDKAREKLTDPSYDVSIAKEVSLARELGANYITVDTPYDEEFLPYLRRWVRQARSQGLKVWYRGSFSSYEGWFDYPKDMSPDELLVETKKFILNHRDLFEDGDIFDPCPECENGKHWPQPAKNTEYNAFLRKKQKVLQESFRQINKNVIYNWNSIIGGRAKEVLDQQTMDYLGNVVAIDHYVSDVSSYREYIEYFRNHNTKTVIGEFGSPIPDIHGAQTESEQAEFIEKMLDILYSEKESVIGVNYWVLTLGTTALYNADYSPRQAAQILRNYYHPVIIRGIVTNTLGDPLENIIVKTTDNRTTALTDKRGFYQIVVPAGLVSLTIGGTDHQSQSFHQTLTNGDLITYDIRLEPIDPDLFYQLRLKLHNLLR